MPCLRTTTLLGLVLSFATLPLGRPAHGDPSRQPPTPCTPLYFAARSQRDDAAALAALLTAGAAVDGDPRCEKPPLHEVTSHAKLASLRFLLSKGANPNGLSVAGTIPLTEAVLPDNEPASLQMIEELLRAGAQVNARDARGQTALLKAVQATQLAVAERLLAKGADPRITDTSGNRAVSWAPDEGGFKKRLVAIADGMKGPVPAPVFMEAEAIRARGSFGQPGLFWIGKETRVGLMSGLGMENGALRLVDPDGNDVAAAPESPLRDYFPIGQVLDLDGDGARDFSLLLKEGASSTFSLYLSLRGGQTSLLVNYDAGIDRLTGSVPITSALRAPVASELERRGGLTHDQVQRLLATYRIMVDVEALNALQADHAQALRAYKAHKPARAAALLDDALTDGAVGVLDPGGRDETVTAILNDHGFFLLEAGLTERAVAALRVVIARAPDRAVAYLNLADAEHARGDLASAGVHYRRYATLMEAAGKRDKVPARVSDRAASH
jgi:hypothetical protein